MKIKVLDKLLLLLAAVAVALIGAALFVLGLQAGQVAVSNERVLDMGRWPFLAGGALLFVIGVYILSLPQKYRRQRKDAFVLQQTSTGELSISVKAMEHLIHQSVSAWDEVSLKGMQISNLKSGVIVDLMISLASNVSIPLAVSALQKQVKQHLLASTGVDVKEVRVTVETTDSEIKDSPYLVPEQAVEPLQHLEHSTPEHIEPASSDEEKTEHEEV